MCPTPTFGQSPQNTASLSDKQVRDLLVQASDKLDQLKAESQAAQDYIKSLEAKEQKDQELINALKERDQVRQETIKGYENLAASLKQEADAAKAGRVDALKEADREKKRAKRWKGIAKIGTVLGVVVGAGAVVLITK